ncbi:oxidoreductase [Paenibacillus pectinilyticus]|uniref:Oxidoreductase n=1 Tax=Paenibacillus pectinilyticus TaxID=512399 RepID=A0A1C1A4T1_9BACL|nr:Gfo/Idh/MocA family oxidoreductase [Paenibacillus pectinilyticus]OCT15573.1 oxidoreductase [Paenibacillus pectinilyticus]
MSQDIIKVGIIGQGRSGRDIHGNLLVQIPEYYQIVAVADSIPERQALATQEYGCHSYSTWEKMVENEELDLVINASPSHQHFAISLELLNRGFHVLCEKPLAKTAAEVDQLIAASERSGKQLLVFQQSRYQPAFRQMKQIIESGVLGRIVQINFSLNNFARRWDWQTLQSNNGGNLMNTGPHPLDQALQLLGTESLPDITCIMDRANTFGDAEDYVKLIMRKAGHPTIDLEISSTCAYPRETYNIQGTLGGIKGTAEALEWKYFVPEEAPEQKLIREPLVNAEGLPAYCSETLTWHTDNWKQTIAENRTLMSHMTEQLYLMLHRTLTQGVPSEITPQQVRQQLQVIEECQRQNPQIYQD